MKLPRPGWSHDRRDALRRGLQSAVASAATFVAMRALGQQDETFVAVLSAVLILTNSADGSIGQAKARLLSSAVGCAVAVACLLVLPQGWGTAVALAITMFVMGLLVRLKPAWTYGTVAAVALALGAETDLTEATLARLLAIALGAAIGIVTSFLVWGDRALKRFERHRDAALRALLAQLAQTRRAATSAADPVDRDAVRRFHAAYDQARDAVRSTRFSQTAAAQEVLDALDRLFDALIIVDRALEGERTGPDHSAAALDDLQTMLDGLLHGDPSTPDPPREAQRQDPGHHHVLDWALRSLREDAERLRDCYRLP